MVTKVENLPESLKALPQWVCWKGSDKIPKNPHTGGNAMANNPGTWGSYEEAIAACEKYGFDGLGFEFANGYFGVDLDHCTDNIDFCDEFVDGLGSYAEYSKSGSGIHIICKGALPVGNKRRGNVEMYSKGRYFICTGNIYKEQYRKVVDCSESVKPLFEKYLAPPRQGSAERRSAEPVDLDDRDILDKARSCRSGQLFSMLYSGTWQGMYASQSEADLALCNQLAFWCGRNAEQMDRIFRSSGLMRPKWDEKRGGGTYGQITIGKACANCKDVYDPVKYPDDTLLAFSLFRDGTVGVEEPKKAYDMTDTGNAHRLQDRFGSIIRYSYNRKKWYYWDGKSWQTDDVGMVKKYGDMICEDIKNEGYLEQDEKTQADLLKWASRTASSKGKEAMIKECQHLPGIPVMPDELDNHKDYLNCQNGIVNLRNGELTPHDSGFMMSKLCTCDYDVSGKKPELWLKYLEDITDGDKSLQEYIQRCVGYSLTGDTSEQCIYFLHGIGNNGKSTFLETISDMMGGYAVNVQPETIMMKRFMGESANSDIARLKSARFVMAEEPTEGVRLNEGLVKQLTGSARVTCRFLYGDEFEYQPEFKIWLACNHKPVIRGTDFGIWRRIKLIPFEVNIPKEKVDKELPQKLRRELPQILRWAVEGCLKWRESGMSEPVCVLEAVKEYKAEMDLLAGFIEEKIEIDYNCKDRVPAKDLFQAYLKWAKENNEFEMTSKKFFTEMGKRLPEKGRSGKGIYYKYIRILKDTETKQYNIADFYKGGAAV